ncbi:MAG: DUF2267 domain-containing protein [Thiohalomonadaceae bacterium]
MKTSDFVARVRERGKIESSEDAIKASRATLMILSERLKGGEPMHLASQLPREIARFLHTENAGLGRRMTVDEFVRRISELEGVDMETARAHARTVIEVLFEAVSEGEMGDVFAQLPESYHRLFGPHWRH